MAQIKLAEYTFDNSVGDCLPALTPNTITMTKEDTVSGTTTKRIVYIDNSIMPRQISFYGRSSLLTLDYLNMGTNITNMFQMFYSCTSVTMIDCTGWDVSKVTTFEKMFENNPSLKTVDVSGWETTSCTNMSGMFNNCPSLKKIKGIENFNVSSVQNFGAMFYLCKSLTKLDLRNWVTSAPTIATMQNMFSGCESLELLRVDNFDTSKLQHSLSLNGMFQNCKKLKTLNLNSFVNPGNLGNSGSYFCGCSSLEYISMNNFVFGNCTSMGYVFMGCTNLKILDLTQLDTTTMTHPNLDLMIPDIVSGVTCPIYYNSNTCNHPAITRLSNAIDVKGRLMAVYDFNNTSTNADMPTLTGSTVTKTIDTQGSESNITHRVIGVDVMPTAISFKPVTGLLNVDYLAVTSSCIQLGGLFDGCARLESINTFGWDTSNVQGQNNRMFSGCSQLKELDMTWFNTSKITMMRDMFSGCSKLTELDLSSFNTENVTSFQSMFWECANLVTLNVSSFNTEKCTHFPYMFWGCTSLQELDLTNFNTTKNTMGDSVFNLMTSNQIVYVHDTNWTLDNAPATVVRRLSKLLARYTFNNSVSDCLPKFNNTLPSSPNYKISDMVNGTVTTRLISVDDETLLPTRIHFSDDGYGAGRSIITCEYLNTSNCTSLDMLFYGCSSYLTSVNMTGWDTSKVTGLNYAFFNNIKLTEIIGIEDIDTSSLVNAHSIFASTPKLTTLDLSKWDVSKVKVLSKVFSGCGATTINISTWNTESLTDMGAMFCGSSIATVDINHFNVSKVTNASQLFDQCKNLVSVDMSNLHFTSCESISNMFSSCPKLTTVKMADFTGSPLNNILSFCHNANKLTEIDVSTFDTSRVANLQNIFNECYALERIIGIEKWDTSNCIGAYYAFNSCYKISELDLSGWDTRKFSSKDDASMFYSWGSQQEQTVYYEPPYWDLNHKSFNNTANFVIKITRNNGYWLDMTGITGATEITLANENNLPTEEILTDWGDGTQNSELTHTYSTAGEYVVVSNLQNAKSSGNLKDYITKMTVYYASTPANLCFNYNKITKVTLTNNWAEKTIEKYGQKVSMTQMFRNCPLLELPNLEPIKQFKPTYCVGMFYNCQKFTSIDLTGWDLSNCTSIELMFSGCTNLTEIKGIENWNISKCTSVNSLFAACSSLTSLDLSSWDTSSCTDMGSMFKNCTLLTDVSFINEWDLSKVISFNALCHGAKALTSFTLDGKDLSSLNNCNYMLAGNPNLQTVKLTNLTTQKTINMSSMFENDSGLTSVDFSGTNFKPNNTSLAFKNCSSLTSLNLSSWDTSQCANMSHMFFSCVKLKYIDLLSFNTINTKVMTYMFENCQQLQTLDLSSFTFNSDCNCTFMLVGLVNLKMLDISNYSTHVLNNYMLCNTIINTVGMLYSSADSINFFTSNLLRGDNSSNDPYDMVNGLTIYYYDADPSQLTPVEGVTFKKYQNPTTIQLPPHIQLHSLPDGTRDEVDIKTGILTRNIGCLVLDGSEDEKYGNNWSNNGRVYPLGNNFINSQTVICDKLIRGKNWSDTAPDHSYGLEQQSDGSYRIVLVLDNKWTNGANNIQGLKKYLSSNPITFLIKQEPTTEQLILNYNNSCDYGRILPTGMCDKYDVVDSMYTQTMTSILLDGANTWDAMEEFENTVKFTATGTTVGVENLNMLGAGGLYCDNDLFPNINDDSDVPHCRVDEAGNKFYIYVDKDVLMSPDLIGWQIWLQANNFNLIYELEEHLTYVKPYEELDPTQARWEGMDCMRDGAIKYHTNSSDNITMYPTLEYVAPSINNFEVTMLEPNTDYTIYAEGINANDTINFGGTDVNFNNGTVYTSGDNQWLRIDNNDSFYNMVITKGDTTGEVVPYFEGMTSVENPKVQSPCKNLFILQDYNYGANENGDQRNTARKSENGTITFTSPSHGNYASYNIATGEYYPSIIAVGDYNFDYAKTQTLVEGAGTYIIQLDVNYIEGQAPDTYVYYDDSKVVAYSWRNGNDFVLKLTVEKKINFIAVSFWYNSRIVNTTISNIQVEKGEVATDYVRGGGSTVSYTDLKLRSLPNGVKDTINVVTGEYVQRVGEYTLTGDEEGWGWDGNNRRFSLSPVPFSNYKTNISCDNMISKSFADAMNPNSPTFKMEGISLYNTNLFYLLSSNDRTIYLNMENNSERITAFKNKIKNNPTTIYYKLAEPIITKLDPQTLLAYTDGTINLSSDTGLLPTTHYTIPSTNTFHLPSMKTGTRYTLKYPSASGSITIGDITYKISGDSMLFTTPLKINGDTSAIIFSDTNPENVVLLEGAYNKREVPFFTGVKSVKNPNITIIDQLSTESTTYNCETEIELRGLPNGVADKLDIVKGKLTTNVGIRPYQEGDENLPNIWTDGYETVYALSSPVVTNVIIDRPTVTTNSLIELSSDYLIPQLNYRAPSSNNFPLDLLQPNTTYTLYADTLVSGSYTLGGTKTGIYSQPHTITLGDMTDNLLTFNGDLGLSNVMLVKGNSLKTTLPPYFLGIRSVTDGHLLVEGMAGEINELTFDEGIVLRDCNGVKDTIDLITCTLTKRTGEITLTGAEGWFTIPNESVNAPDDYVVFALTLQGVDSSNKYDLICDTITSKYLYNKPHDTESIYGLNNSIRMCVKKSRIGGDTVNALKSWLNQNPTTVVYSLKTPLEVALENVWTTLPPTSYSNQTEISSTVSTNSLKPMISVTIATTTLEEIVSNLEAQNTQLEEENLATMLALTSVYETMLAPSVATTSVEPEPQATTYSMRRSVRSAEPIGMSVSPMGMVYARLVSKGFKSIDEVPYNLQAEVMYALRGME